MDNLAASNLLALGDAVSQSQMSQESSSRDFFSSQDAIRIEIKGRKPGARSSDSISLEDKKRLKRAANRRSAQLSRQRKKVFIEGLTAEYLKLKQVTEILDAVSDIVFMIEDTGKIVFASEAAHRILQYSRESFLGRDIYTMIAKHSRLVFKGVITRTANEYRERQIISNEDEYRHPANAVAESSDTASSSISEVSQQCGTLPPCIVEFISQNGVIVQCEVNGSVTMEAAPVQHAESAQPVLRFVCAARPLSQTESTNNAASCDSSHLSSSASSECSLSNSGASGGSIDSDQGSTSGSAIGSEEGIESN